MTKNPDLQAWLETEDRDIDLFAGPGGWDEGIKFLGIRPLGIEWDKAACETARTAGHLRLQADIARLGPRHFLRDGRPVRRLIASPPCQGFSMAGKGEGRKDSGMLLDAIGKVQSAEDVTTAIRFLHEHMRSDKSLLVLEPLRWALQLMPEVICLEQVPAVLPIWEATADVLRRHGYGVAVGKLSAEQYGVPQTRQRAILIARRDGEVALPVPTHSRYYSRDPKRLDPDVQPWVSMAEALGWNDDASDSIGQARNSGPGAARTPRPGDSPSYTIRAQGSGSHPSGVEWVYVNGTHEHAARRPADRPAPTVMFGARSNGVTWKLQSNYSAPGRPGQTAAERGLGTRDLDVPAFAVTSKAFHWAFERPATTVAGTGRIGQPGHKHMGDCHPDQPRTRQFDSESVRVTVQEAAVLQSFPANYLWQGTKTKQYEQVGNAVPPLLARAVVQAALGKEVQ